MIHDADESIRAWMQRDVLNGSNVEISFDAPTKEWSAHQNTPSLNFYLYDIQEDLERRDVQQRDIRGDNGRIAERKLPPRFFRLSYLVTAWTQRPEDEHRLLSAVLSAMVASDFLQEDVLRGSLVDAQQPIKTTIALPLPKDRSISDVWSAMGGEMKPSLDLIVSVPFEISKPEPVGAIVTEEPRFTFVGPDGIAEPAGPNGTTETEEAGRAGFGAPTGPEGPAATEAGGGRGSESSGESKQQPRDDVEGTPRQDSEPEETIHGGKQDSGRRITIRAIPRPPRAPGK